TATHPDGTRCATETRAVRALLPGGPYESRQQASIDGQPLRDAVNAATGEHDGPLTDAEYDAMRQAATDYLTTRLTRFGVELGVFDQRIAAWMADWEPHVVAVILGWVQRAHQAGRDSAASRC
ncbi:hypothetical protein, partial [Actinocrinis sp.]|uniref:hypothetical protein n=1 Tax=Actinocrinis sp. TaxID=1920516 RepID=UPI002D4363AF